MDDSVTKVIFLDIDGPVISSQDYFGPGGIMASFDRVINPNIAGVLKEIATRTGAAYVINSTHNRQWKDAPDIVQALVKAGVPEHMFFSGPLDRTKYPDLRRLEAIEDWIVRFHEEQPKRKIKWAALDDDMFLPEDDPRMVWVHPDYGTSIPEMRKLIEFFGGKQLVVLN